MKQIVAINTSPRVNWNTATLVQEAAKGAESAGAKVQYYDLYKLEKFTGCISCFGCKQQANLGRCICRDGLTPVLEAVRQADGLIIGTPNYLGDVTAGFRAFYERLIFQYITYKMEPRSYSESNIPVVFIMTSNAPEEYYTSEGYGKMVAGYQGSLSNFIGPTKVLLYGNTLQVNDYDRYDWTMFDPAIKKVRHEEVLPRKKQEAFQLGSEMVR